MLVNNFFWTPIWSEEKPEFVKSLNKVSNEYIKNARKKNKDHIKKHGDFGISHHSVSLLSDNNFLDFRNYVGQKSWEFLDNMGYDMKKYKTIFTEMWVQEFAKKGGGHHAAHVHWNQHVSGFYFLKCSDKTSHPIFHEPRAGAQMTKLKLKPENEKNIWPGTDVVHLYPLPGTMIIFPGYLGHEYTVDFGLEPFRFIHWNIQAVPEEVVKND
tara:strand:+ start:251 stop:886 length:636 start_codon:yes stop_codon:yes gene_type:complete